MPSNSRFISLLTAAAVIPATAFAISTPTIANGGFEEGDLTGWATNFSGGRYAIDDGETLPAEYPGDPTDVPFFANNGYEGRPLISVQESDAPSGGESMLQLNSEQSDLYDFSFTDSSGTDWLFAPSDYTISLQQELNLSAMDMVSGLARFVTSDFPEFGDYASVTIGDEIVWYQDIADVFDLESFEETRFSFGDWQEWMWSAPSDGNYLLSLNIYGDEQFDSLAYFDNIAALPGPSSVPDSGGAAALLGIALIACGAFARRLNQA